MNSRERENATLSFQKPSDRGAVQETFGPWDLTVKRWVSEGLPSHIAENLANNNARVGNKNTYPFNGFMSDGCNAYEQHLGFDSVMRLHVFPPFAEGVAPDEHGHTADELPPEEKWNTFKEGAKKTIEKFFADENIEKFLSCYKESHDKGEYSVRLFIVGFFEYPRSRMGIEEHLYAFYDYPELLHDMNEFLLQFYLDKLGKVLDVLPADVIYMMEDLSGRNGPMLSPQLFDEFVGSYYKRLIPMLKSKGVKHVFVDTDGDFNVLIPNFIEAGIEGFLPMDVNAGMDIVAVRQNFPNLKFIGGFNKLRIAEGKEAIDREFERLLPVIRQGGYIPGCDHQVAPSTPFENYQYYIKRLKEVMTEAGADTQGVV